MEVQGKKVTVIGLGKSGFSAAKWLSRQRADVTVSDIKKASEIDPDITGELVRIGVRLQTGGHDRDTFLSSDLIVISPGVPHDMAPLAAARSRGIPILGEMELAFRWIDIPVLAVTGTNGKSTVTTLLGSMIRNAGYKAFVGGNIGTPLIDYLADGQRADLAVVEVSSFQLDTAETFSPHIALLLNITPDHLDRYAGYEEYVKSKLSIFRHQGPGQFAILNDDDPRLSRYAPSGPSVLRYGLNPGEHRHAWIEGNTLIARVPNGREHPFDLKDFALPGSHNRENLMGVVLAGLALQIEPPVIQTTIRSFRGLPHRIELAGRFEGVSFYDDSKATNVDAAMRSILSFDHQVVLIAGGRHKGADYGPLVRAVKAQVRKAVLLGEAKSIMADSLKGEIPYEFAGDMQEAVNRAFSSARRNDVVLLAPACSSFDMYRDYAHRGNVFRQAVEVLCGGA